jgi:hypothetical protein
MFYEIYKGYKQEKIKNKAEKNAGCLRIISHYGNFAGIIIFPLDDNEF